MLNRRNFLEISAATFASMSTLGKLLQDNTHNGLMGGWVDLPKERKKFLAKAHMPLGSQHVAGIAGSSDDKQAMLWKAWEKAAGHDFVCHEQELGDCVSHGGGLGVETLSAVESLVPSQKEKWCGKTSTEVLYGGSRVEVGGGQLKGDGSTGAWLAEFLEDYGTVARGKYGDIDLTNYDPALAKEWGAKRSNGIPSEMETLSKQHPVRKAALIDGGFDQACDFMYNGNPVVICSSVGFHQKADSDGFLRAGPTWMHCMLLWGFDKKSRRQGGCIANSWPPEWTSGPQHKLGTPSGCFWAEARTIDKMLREGDSYALADYKGFRRRNLDYLLW